MHLSLPGYFHILFFTISKIKPLLQKRKGIMRTPQWLMKVCFSSFPNTKCMPMHEKVLIDRTYFLRWYSGSRRGWTTIGTGEGVDQFPPPWHHWTHWYSCKFSWHLWGNSRSYLRFLSIKNNQKLKLLSKNVIWIFLGVDWR